jgi:DNA-binding PadR family transcriptional regulator
MHQEDDWPRRGGGRRRSRYSEPIPVPVEHLEDPEGGGPWGPPRRRGGGPGGPRRHGPGFGGARFWMGEEPQRRPRVRRGDVRAAALALLAEEPRNGYQVIQEIAARSGGVWQPSPGSVYPALQQLEDEGLIRAENMEGGRKGFTLTDEGRSYMTEHADEVTAPWEIVAGREHGSVREMRPLIGQVAMAAMQVTSAGSEAQVAKAQRILKDTRRNLYRILAADEDAEDGAETGPGTGAEEAPEERG